MQWSNRIFWTDSTGYHRMEGALEVGTSCVNCTPATEELFSYERMLASLRQPDLIWLMRLAANCFNPLHANLNGAKSDAHTCKDAHTHTVALWEHPAAPTTSIHRTCKGRPASGYLIFPMRHPLDTDPGEIRCGDIEPKDGVRAH